MLLWNGIWPCTQQPVTLSCVILIINGPSVLHLSYWSSQITMSIPHAKEKSVAQSRGGYWWRRHSEKGCVCSHCVTFTWREEKGTEASLDPMSIDWCPDILAYAVINKCGPYPAKGVISFIFMPTISYWWHEPPLHTSGSCWINFVCVYEIEVYLYCHLSLCSDQ